MRLSEVAKSVSDAEWSQRKDTARRAHRNTLVTGVTTSSLAAGGVGAAINSGRRNRIIGGLGSAGLTAAMGGTVAANRQRKLRRTLRDNDAVLRARYTRAKEAGLAKSDDAQRKANAKRKEATFGVVNNVASAGMGMYGARAVYNQARAKQEAAGAIKPRKVKPPKPPKPPGKVRTKVRATAARLPAPVKARVKRVAPYAAIGGAVGSQLFNVGGDVQAASYFARDLAANKRGTRIPDEKKPVAKAMRDYDPEQVRRHRLGVFEGAGLAGGGVTAALGAQKLRASGKFTRKRLLAAGKRHKVPLALLAAGGTAMAGGGAAGRQARKERNESPWT